MSKPVTLEELEWLGNDLSRAPYVYETAKDMVETRRRLAQSYRLALRVVNAARGRDHWCTEDCSLCQAIVAFDRGTIEEGESDTKDDSHQ